ncbi:MAG: phosphotransferase family protein, partial [Comamonadaceae bacterium]
WVEENLPQRWTPAVVHADFRTGNLIVGPDGVRCVLDWEIARIGDAMQDLGVLCMRSWRFGGSGEVGGFGEREDLYVAYEAASGQAVDPQRVRFWEAFSNLKWAIACARRGASQRPDGRQISVELSAVGRRMEEPLWDFLSLTGATPGSIR